MRRRSHSTVAREPIEAHPVMIALSKAHAMAAVLDCFGDSPLTGHLALDHCPEGTRDWLQDVVATALREAIDEADAEFRKSAREQVLGPKAVA
jgi:hypothetical protein